MSSRTTRSSTSANRVQKSQGKAPVRSSTSQTSKKAASKPASTVTTTSQQANGPKPVYFWREYGSPNSFLSQWYPSPFHFGDGGIVYKTAEQCMMHQKALLFHDHAIAKQILETDSPKIQKGLGRKVSNFSEEIWIANRSRIVEETSYFKFKYGLDQGVLHSDGEEADTMTLKERLLATEEKELVEASPMDKIWGIGFGEKNAEEKRDRWGLNLLGKALMVARDRLRADELEEAKKA